MERQALHAYLSQASHDAWQLFAEENGVSVTGLIEMLGLQIAADVEDAGDATEVRQDWVRQSRKVDARRRRRGAA
jgi:hypothetical protein